MAADSPQIAFELLSKNRKYVGLEEDKEGKWKGSFYFIQGADSQLGMIENYLEKKPDPQWTKEIVLFKKAVSAVNKMKPRPRFFVICGDLIDAYPGTKNNMPQIIDFKKIFSELHPDIKPVCVCGNHDIGNTPTPDSVQHYINNFGDDYFTFWVGGVLFIVLNSQFYVDASMVKQLKEEQDKWLDEQLAIASGRKCKHIIVLQHVPPFIKNPQEKEIYFNFQLDVRKDFINKLKKAGVRAIFCGHYHQNAGGFDESLEIVVTSAIGAQLGKDSHGLRVVKVLEDSIQHTYYNLDEIPKEVKF